MTIKEISSRYSITEASAKARIQYLDLNVSSISSTDLDQLDALADHLEAGNAITSFSYTPTASVEVVDAPSKIVRMAKEPIPEATQTVYIQTSIEDLEKLYRFLQEAADKQWHLPTSVVRSITGATPRGKRWKRYGFAFEAATKHGVEKAWAVSQSEWDFPPS